MKGVRIGFLCCILVGMGIGARAEERAAQTQPAAAGTKQKPAASSPLRPAVEWQHGLSTSLEQTKPAGKDASKAGQPTFHIPKGTFSQRLHSSDPAGQSGQAAIPAASATATPTAQPAATSQSAPTAPPAAKPKRQRPRPSILRSENKAGQPPAPAAAPPQSSGTPP